jgi:hypothetical protein
MTSSPEQAHHPWPLFLGWLFIGALWMAVFASMASIGIFLLPVAGVATWFMSRRPESRLGMAALISLGAWVSIGSRPSSGSEKLGKGQFAAVGTEKLRVVRC